MGKLALFNIHHIKFSKEKPYLTEAETRAFKRLREEDGISFFKTGTCKRPGCGKEVPKSKDYCSKTCFETEARRTQREREREDDEDQED